MQWQLAIRGHWGLTPLIILKSLLKQNLLISADSKLLLKFHEALDINHLVFFTFLDILLIKSALLKKSDFFCFQFRINFH